MENMPSQLDESAQAAQSEFVWVFLKKNIHAPGQVIAVLPEITSPEKCYKRFLWFLLEMWLHIHLVEE